MTMAIRPATAADLGTAIELLKEAGLCFEDLSADMLAFVAETNAKFQGVIGRECFADIAFMRSLVISGDARGAGVGHALVTALETACVTDGIGELWLLTFDADLFFAKLGYVIRDRADAPDAIRNTEEFRALCPADAVLMSKFLL